MLNKHLLFLLCCFSLFSGCRHYGVLVKRESELNCPTDIRKTVPWCAGEDAVFCCPCGPNEQFHGHKPTCWRLWQTSGEEWRDLHCAPLGSQRETASQYKTGIPEIFPGERVIPPIEDRTPTKPGPDMPFSESKQQEESPTNNSPMIDEETQEETRPDSDNESLPEPDEVSPQFDTPVSQVRPVFPRKQVHKSSSAGSLTDYFQHANKESKGRASYLRDHATIGIVESKPVRLPEPAPRTLTATNKSPSERPMLLPPVEKASPSVSQKTVSQKTLSPQTLLEKRKVPAASAVLGGVFNQLSPTTQVTSKDKPSRPTAVRRNRTMTNLNGSDTLLRIVLADPPESLAGELAVKPVAHFGKRPEHFTSSGNLDSASKEKPGIAASPSQSQLAIVSSNATKPQTKEPIRILNLSPPKQPPHVKGSRSPALIFVR